MPCFLGRDVWLLELRASHQVTLLLLSEMDKNINCAGIKGTDSFFFGPGLGRGSPGLWLGRRSRPCEGEEVDAQEVWAG